MLTNKKVKIAISLNVNEIAIENVCNLHQTTDELSIQQYNTLLVGFTKNIIDPNIDANLHDHVVETLSHFEWKDVIPLSHSYLENWLAFFPLSSHPLDRRRWFDFLIALVKNNESLDITYLEEYARTSLQWDEDSIKRCLGVYSEEVELLSYALSKKPNLG